MEKWSLTALADELLSQALSASTGRDVYTVDGGRPHLLNQTVIALACGQRLDEHDNPGEATVQVLRGRVRVTTGDDTTDGSPGQLLIVPGVRHPMNCAPLPGYPRSTADTRQVELGDGQRIGYDALLLATGATPRRLDVPDADVDGVLPFRCRRAGLWRREPGIRGRAGDGTERPADAVVVGAGVRPNVTPTAALTPSTVGSAAELPRTDRHDTTRDSQAPGVRIKPGRGNQS